MPCSTNIYNTQHLWQIPFPSGGLFGALTTPHEKNVDWMIACLRGDGCSSEANCEATIHSRPLSGFKVTGTFSLILKTGCSSSGYAQAHQAVQFGRHMTEVTETVERDAISLLLAHFLCPRRAHSGATQKDRYPLSLLGPLESQSFAIFPLCFACSQFSSWHLWTWLFLHYPLTTFSARYCAFPIQSKTLWQCRGQNFTWIHGIDVPALTLIAEAHPLGCVILSGDYFSNHVGRQPTPPWLLKDMPENTPLNLWPLTQTAAALWWNGLFAVDSRHLSKFSGSQLYGHLLICSKYLDISLPAGLTLTENIKQELARS